MNGLEVRDNSRPILRTTKGHLLIDTDIDPAHFKIVPISPIPLVSIAGESVQQTVLQIPHKLPYAPFVDCYFFPAGAVPNKADQFFQIDGTYWHSWFPFNNPSGPETDGLFVKVDDVNLNVIYIYDPVAAGTSVPVPVKMKYSIFSNPGYAQF